MGADGTPGATLGDDDVPWLQANAAASMGTKRPITFMLLFFRRRRQTRLPGENDGYATLEQSTSALMRGDVNLRRFKSDISDLMPVDRSHPIPTRARSGPHHLCMDLALKTRFAARIVPRLTTPPTFLSTLRLRSVLFAHDLRQGTSVNRLARRRPDPPEHRPEQPPREMALRQQEPVVADVLDQPPTRLDEALLKAGERPAVNALRQHEPPLSRATAYRGCD